jgi:hypothetical protein
MISFDLPGEGFFLFFSCIAYIQTSLPLVIARPEWICAKMLVGQEDSGFCKSAVAGLRPENGNGTFLP